jgi:hypothetical protein
MLRGFCAGHAVTDLGAGGGSLSGLLVGLGATQVVAVEKDEMPHIQGVQHRRELFQRLDARGLPLRLLISWPINDHTVVLTSALAGLLESAEEILYIGENSRFTVCGWNGLWREFAHRKVLSHVVVDGGNTVIHYGPRLRRRRGGGALLLEERRAWETFVRKKP